MAWCGIGKGIHVCSEHALHQPSLVIRLNIKKKNSFSTVAQWKKQRKNLRDSYHRHRKINEDKRSGDAAKPIKKWVYADILSFLDEHVSENR